MAKCNEIVFKMTLYDNDDEHKLLRQQCRFWRKSALKTPCSPV